VRIHCVPVRYCVVLHIKVSQQQKQKHTTLTLFEKLEILNKLENGDKLVNLAKKSAID